MKLVKILALSAAAAFCLPGSGDAALTKDFYKAKSILSQDKWVKVGVETTGVYEISYQTLREMGFSNPEKVSVYGRGGRVLPESFVSNSGTPILTDDLAPVKVIHEDGKLYFYGLGPEEITFETSTAYPTGGYFIRKSNNIYSRRGYYFLTDSQTVSEMTLRNYDASSATKITKGVGYVYHELDSVYNSTESGQLFWGERVGLPGATKRTWDVEMPDAMAGEGVMECVMYFEPSDYKGGEGGPKVNYGFEGTTGYFSAPYKENTAVIYAPHEPTVGKIEIPGASGTVFTEFANSGEMSNFSNLDYWVVSYPSAIPTLTGPNGNRLNQQLIAIPGIAKNSMAQVQLADPASLVAIEVSTVTAPERLKISQSNGIGTIGVKNTSGKTPILVVFDKQQPQLQISGYDEDYTLITNQNLHAYKETGADYIIISTPKFRPYAEKIAQLHRDYDGIDVVVATTEECYNEFSAGTPDPMAYRSFAKMLYFHETKKPKNMLLLGPLNADFRGLNTERDPMEAIIAYQSPTISVSRGAHNINDFYGMMSDKFRTDYYERNDVQIGVGILPVIFEADAQIVVNKIENYLKRTDHAYYLNRYTGISGIGDDHTHDIQLRDIYNHMRTLDNRGTLLTPIAIDTYGKAEARKKFLNSLTEGCNMFSYFGHGAEMFLGKDRYFFNAGDVYALRNTVLPLALFGGCYITNTDRGMRGLGETIVTATPYGSIGAVVSARETWSGQNYEFFKQFFTCLYTVGSTTSSEKRTTPPTIGEVYAKVKNYSSYANELAYQLLCDPALVIPSINRTIQVKANVPEGQDVNVNPGNGFSLSGSVTDFNGNVDTGFNGEVVLRLCEPEVQVPAGNLETNEDPKNLVYTYRDSQVSMMVAEVKNGNFDINIHVPSSLASHVGEDAILYFCAYDPSTKVAGARSFTVGIEASSSASQESGDKVAPVIEQLAFDNTDCSISFRVSDNLALNLSTNPLNKGFYLYIDGKERSEAHFAEGTLEAERAVLSKKILIDGISYGEHTARLKAKDAAGNATEREIVFTYQPNGTFYMIAKDDSSTKDTTVVKTLGTAPSKATLVVISSTGSEVWRGEFTDGTVEWDHNYASGGKVPAGHYKAYLLETGNGALKGHSETIDIPVI